MNGFANLAGLSAIGILMLGLLGSDVEPDSRGETVVSVLLVIEVLALVVGLVGWAVTAL